MGHTGPVRLYVLELASHRLSLVAECENSPHVLWSRDGKTLIVTAENEAGEYVLQIGNADDAWRLREVIRGDLPLPLLEI